MPEVRSPHPFPLYVLRHGETEWNVAERVQGSLDSALTGRGRAQAAEQRRMLAAALGNEWPPVWCSPQPRALASARILTAGRAAAPRPDERLREMSLGRWEGLTMAEVETVRPGIIAADPFAWRFLAPGGDSYADLAERLADFLGELTGPAVVVTHGIASRVLRALALGVGPAEAGELPGGQGRVHIVADGLHRTL